MIKSSLHSLYIPLLTLITVTLVFFDCVSYYNGYTHQLTVTRRSIGAKGV